MRLKKKYSGIIVPMITPFTQNGTIDEKSLEKIIENFIANGASPFAFGTTGEGSSIEFKEKCSAAKTIVEIVNGRSLTYADISSNSIDESINLGKAFHDVGIDAVTAHLPTYYALNPDQMLSYYENLVEKISSPLILYNISATTHMSIPLEVIEKLSHHPQIVGLKDSERDLERLQTAIRNYSSREDFSHLIGWGGQCCSGLILGSDGLVPSTGNFIPGIYNEMYNAVLTDDNDNALQLQKQTEEISAVYQKGKLLGESLAALKVIMNVLQLCDKNMIPPLTKLSKEDEEEVLRNFKNIQEKYTIR